jgi:hypothetical protein
MCFAGAFQSIRIQCRAAFGRAQFAHLPPPAGMGVMQDISDGKGADRQLAEAQALAHVQEAFRVLAAR